jgi:hypothetical protein
LAGCSGLYCDFPLSRPLPRAGGRLVFANVDDAIGKHNAPRYLLFVWPLEYANQSRDPQVHEAVVAYAMIISTCSKTMDVFLGVGSCNACHRCSSTQGPGTWVSDNLRVIMFMQPRSRMLTREKHRAQPADSSTSGDGMHTEPSSAMHFALSSRMWSDGGDGWSDGVAGAGHGENGRHALPWRSSFHIRSLWSAT